MQPPFRKISFLASATDSKGTWDGGRPPATDRPACERTAIPVSSTAGGLHRARIHGNLFERKNL